MNDFIPLVSGMKCDAAARFAAATPQTEVLVASMAVRSSARTRGSTNASRAVARREPPGASPPGCTPQRSQRTDRRPPAICAQTYRLHLWDIYVVAAIGAVANTFQASRGWRRSHSWCPKKQLGRAGGMDQVNGGMSLVISPLNAGARPLHLVPRHTDRGPRYLHRGIGPLSIVRSPRPKPGRRYLRRKRGRPHRHRMVAHLQHGRRVHRHRHRPDRLAPVARHTPESSHPPAIQPQGDDQG